MAPGRHLTTTMLLEHWDSGVPVLVPVAGNPSLQLRIDPPRGRLTLRAPVAPDVELPSNQLTHISREVLIVEGKRFIEISTTDERLMVDGYAMLTAVADRIQLDGLSPLAALEATLATWRSILAMRVRMSPQAEIGLFGELLVLEALPCDGDLAAAWRGGISEEHDFGFAEADVEVKTTAAERRRHRIHGLGQLVATGRTPLWVLSVQITRAGANQGRTLPELIDRVVELAPPGEPRTCVQQVLGAAGWREEERDLFVEAWRLRTSPLAFKVDDSFPCLTPQHLIAGGVDIAGIRDVSYEIDVTGRPGTPGVPSSLTSILMNMETAPSA